MHDHNAPLGVAAGIASAVLLSLGLDPLLVQWAAIAAGGGLLLATQIRKWLALAAFPVVVLMSAAIGQSIGKVWFNHSQAVEMLLVIGFGFLFHALVPVVVQHIPNVLGTFLSRLGKKEAPKE